MELFKSMCSKIVSPLHESASPQAFELSVSFLITNASNKTRICLRVEDQYISAGQDEVSKYALISGFPRYLEWQQEQHANPGMVSQLHILAIVANWSTFPRQAAVFKAQPYAHSYKSSGCSLTKIEQLGRD
jgi:hypothetical protein